MPGGERGRICPPVWDHVHSMGHLKGYTLPLGEMEEGPWAAGRVGVGKGQQLLLPGEQGKKLLPGRLGCNTLTSGLGLEVQRCQRTPGISLGLAKLLMLEAWRETWRS